MIAICADSDLRADWRGLLLTLRETKLRAPDEQAREMIQRKFDKWRDALIDWDPTAEDSKAELKRLITGMTSFLPDDLTAVADLRAFLEPYSGGPFEGYSSSCGYISSNDWVRSELYCAGTIRLEHEGRVCTAEQLWVSGHYVTYFYVDDAVSGRLQHRGHCVEWYASVNAICPFDEANSDVTPHWNSDRPDTDSAWPFDGTGFPLEHSGGKIPGETLNSAADILAWTTTGSNLSDWLHTCLTTPDYPPPDQTGRVTDPTLKILCGLPKNL